MKRPLHRIIIENKHFKNENKEENNLVIIIILISADC